MLLLNYNRLVTIDQLLEAIYGECLPSTARSQVQISISALRRLFVGHDEICITRSTHGYTLQVDSGRLDRHRFEELVRAGRSARDARHLDEAVANYRDALRLWRGPALDGIDSHLVEIASSRLNEERAAVNEDRIQLELGRHHELIGELSELTDQFPLRERPRAQLMLALYRCDRVAEALEVHRRGCQVLTSELGIGPGSELRQLNRAILRSDPGLRRPAEVVRLLSAELPAPLGLPTDNVGFTGHSEEADTAGEALRRLFRRLAILEADFFSSWVSAALLHAPLSSAEDLLDLVSAQLSQASEPEQPGAVDEDERDQHWPA